MPLDAALKASIEAVVAIVRDQAWRFDPPLSADGELELAALLETWHELEAAVEQLRQATVWRITPEGLALVAGVEEAP